MKKARTLFATLCLAFVFTSCIGPNPLQNKVRNWNATATDNKYANGAIGIVGVPLQGFAWLADITILNAWEYWAGESLVEDSGPYPTVPK